MGARQASIVVAATFTALVLSGCTRIQPIYTVDQRPVPVAAQRLPATTLGEMIAEAAYARGWTVEQVEPGFLRATEKWREHSTTVEIRYTSQTYSILYSGSANLKADGGQIHRRYNALVRALEEEIERRLYNAAS